MLGERLHGLLLILAGCTMLLLVYAGQAHVWPRVRPLTPPGFPSEMLPALPPLVCILPLLVVGSLGLCLVGARKLLAPDNWRPPKHLG